MASTVARAAVQRSPCPDRTLDQIVVCATSFEHDLALSCAGRLHSELRSANAPFAIGQLQGASFLLALQLACSMMSLDNRVHAVLIVGAERWLAPFPRVVGTLTAFGDGAAAALIEQRTGAGWYVRSVTVRTPAPAASITPDDEYVDEPALVQVIDETCARAGLQPSAINWTVPARISTSLARAITTHAGLATDRIWYPDPDDTGYLCAADTPAQLDTLLRSLEPRDGQHILLWSAGFQGQAACAILEFRGSW
ncbi:3-oxoacyl-[acyl-carrier-protein] synthase III C-terminal domain-containing protein [Paraburkholderia gardini]|nr:3-oxoacyl-[acyl-carrier-protein] synthase III C-terminal domain-containing protein [Paraburkholderia gardini]